MIKGWIIRSVFMLPVLLFASGWLWSGTHRGLVEYHDTKHDGRGFTCWSENGVTAVYFDYGLGKPSGWRGGVEPSTPASYWPTTASLRSHLGFGWVHHASTSYSFYAVAMPYWLLILASAGVWVLVWRKTRPATRGRERRQRRALTHDEMSRLLAVNASRRVVYLAAVQTGLRRAELESLRWDDVHLEAARPFLTARASTTKNHLRAHIFLRDDLAAALRAILPPSSDGAGAVFEGRIPDMPTFKADLATAGIPRKDAMGRVVDFHALRHTLATNLANAKVGPQRAMEIMRHSE